MEIRLQFAALTLLLCVAHGAMASGQAAGAARVGVYRATPVDTAIIAIVRPSRIGKYMTIGAALGAASAIGFVGYALTHCDGSHQNGLPGCLGLDVVGTMALGAGTVGGGLIGWGAGLLADARRR
ncbi:hypothetical protein BH09GEM1_BH09GEM1_06750 [soil metagenome]